MNTYKDLKDWSKNYQSKTAHGYNALQACLIGFYGGTKTEPWVTDLMSQLGEFENAVKAQNIYIKVSETWVIVDDTILAEWGLTKLNIQKLRALIHACIPHDQIINESINHVYVDNGISVDATTLAIHGDENKLSAQTKRRVDLIREYLACFNDQLGYKDYMVAEAILTRPIFDDKHDLGIIFADKDGRNGKGIFINLLNTLHEMSVAKYQQLGHHASRQIESRNDDYARAKIIDASEIDNVTPNILNDFLPILGADLIKTSTGLKRCNALAIIALNGTVDFIDTASHRDRWAIFNIKRYQKKIANIDELRNATRAEILLALAINLKSARFDNITNAQLRTLTTELQNVNDNDADESQREQIGALAFEHIDGTMNVKASDVYEFAQRNRLTKLDLKAVKNRLFTAEDSAVKKFAGATIRVYTLKYDPRKLKLTPKQKDLEWQRDYKTLFSAADAAAEILRGQKA